MGWGKREARSSFGRVNSAHWNNYVEPMAGSAAMFFHLAPRKAVLADINAELINFYDVLKDNAVALVEKLESLRASRRLYYRMRKMKPSSRLQKAVRFAYLNRLCWNGLYRVNREGNFNVPIGDRLPRTLWNAQKLLQASRLLQDTKLLCADFETTLGHVPTGSFVFIDPPYPRGARTGFGFNRYSRVLFSLRDHRRLGDVVASLDRKRISLMILLANRPEIVECYPSSFERTVIHSKSLISCSSPSRGAVAEVVLTNYSPITNSRSSEDMGVSNATEAAGSGEAR